MNCKTYARFGIDYQLNLLDDSQRSEYEAHIATCPDCREALSVDLAILNELEEEPLQPLPEDYKATLHDALVSRRPPDVGRRLSTITRHLKRHYKYWSVSIAALLVVALLASGALDGMLRGGDAMMSSDRVTDAWRAEQPNSTIAETAAGAMVDKAVLEGDEQAVAMESERMDATGDQLKKTDLQARKLIKRGDVNLVVSDFDLAVAGVNAAVNAAEGYVEDSRVSVYQQYVNNQPIDYRDGYLTLRIPSHAFQTVFDQLLTLGRVTNHAQNSSDITNEYRDTVSEVKNLEVREAALRKIMEKAESIEDVIAVDAELSKVRAQINQYTGQIQQWDRLVDMATIQVQLVEQIDEGEAVQPIDDNLLSRAGRAFIANLNRLINLLESLFVGIIGIVPIVLPLLVAVAIGYTIIKNRRKSS